MWQWGLILFSSIVFFIGSPLAKSKSQFFAALKNQKAPSATLLTGSLVISWIFAKSITNAANLGRDFGILGGIAYAAYYLSFAVAGILIYNLRKHGGYVSLHHFLASKFGISAVSLFSLLIVIRLFNEVWSNTIVIGTYFGETGTIEYYIAILAFTALTLAYALKGGLSSSIFTDAIQMILFAILLSVILIYVFSDTNFDINIVATSSEWTMEAGGNLLLAAILQSFSYPFHDPVLTDRGFISEQDTTLRSFIWASVIGGICIILFSYIGIYAKHMNLHGQAAVMVSKSFGIVMLLLVNFIMITSASSTLDSTFASFSKLVTIDLSIVKTLKEGRWSMVLIAILGTVPVFLDAKILSATTISGTMVIGLTPVFLFWKMNVPKISFFLSVLCGLFFGFLLMLDVFPSELILTKGKYASLLWINVWGILSCVILYVMPKWIKK